MEQRCQVPMHVWEASCASCGGLGCAKPRASWAGGGRGRGRGRGTPHAAYTTCAVGSGIGYVRHTSSRVWPDMKGGGTVAGGSSEGGATSFSFRSNTTLGRPPRMTMDESDDEWETDSEGEEEESE